MSIYIRQLKDVSMRDLAVVGGKNASLGELISVLGSKGIAVPDGFATTAAAFRLFLQHNMLDQEIDQVMQLLDRRHYGNLQEIGRRVRALLLQAPLPSDLCNDIVSAYRTLCGDRTVAVAVRSSATAEDLPEASFAGLHESYLNIEHETELLEAVHKCYASLYTDRAIKYREDHGFVHSAVALSVGVQRMVRSDTGSAGVVFTLEPESGFRGVIHVAGAWGLGENVVQGAVIPDEYLLYKQGIRENRAAILQKKIGEKGMMMVYADDGHGTMNVNTPADKRATFVLSDHDVVVLARWALLIEDHYQKPMDIEWAKDGLTDALFIVQARPETVHSQRNPRMVTVYNLLEKRRVLAQGEAIGNKIAAGTARVLHSPAAIDQVKPGDIVVTDSTSPDWDPVLKNAGAIVTDRGGRTSHASIIARELGVPAVVGCLDATRKINDGDLVTVSCAEGSGGYVYAGKCSYEKQQLDFTEMRLPASLDVMLILGDPDKAFALSFYPCQGVGLLRMEFIVTHAIQAHPMALVNYDVLQDPVAREVIAQLTKGYADKRDFFVEKLSQGIATIAAAFYPREVVVRLSDFKTNEYANLLGGKEFEPAEENPMLGFRGASRYYHEKYREGFALECRAIRFVREAMGLTNVSVMVPFCRTVTEAEKVLLTMSQHGLTRGEHGLKVLVMAEIPSNILLADEFAKLFDGFSIGSNDLTQLTLGIDRDSATVAGLFDEQNKAVKKMITSLIQTAHAAGVHVGLCGQAPSDFPAFAQFLAREGIDSISFNPDALLAGIENINKAERLLQAVQQ